jgi:hypothetical protein
MEKMLHNATQRRTVQIHRRCAFFILFPNCHVGRSFTKHWSAGVGCNQATGSYIRGNNGRSKGLIPMLRNFNETARYVEQGGGKRSLEQPRDFNFFGGRCSAGFQLILVRKLLVITPRSSSESSFTRFEMEYTVDL